jgi:DNA-binding MarR family transcriptional regulator
MAAANGAASSHFREIHRDFGANYFACLVLIELAWRPGAIPLGDLPQRLSRPRTTVSSAVGRLLEGGYVEVRRDPRDRRRRMVALTARGRRLAAQADGVLGGIEEGLDEEDQPARMPARAYAKALATQVVPLVDEWIAFRDDARFYDLAMPFERNAWWDRVPDTRRGRDREQRERTARERAPPTLPA